MSSYYMVAILAVCFALPNAAAAEDAATQSKKDEPAEPSTQPQPTGRAGPATDTAAVGPASKPTATAPASAPAGTEMAEVISVSGSAQRRLPGEDQQWQPLEVGELLDLRTIIRTGLGAKVVLMFGDRSEVIIANATKVGIGRFSKRENLVRIHLGPCAARGIDVS